MKSMIVSCGNCEYWKRGGMPLIIRPDAIEESMFGPKSTIGHCAMRAPVVASPGLSSIAGRYPTTHAKSGCGQGVVKLQGTAQ